MAHPSPPLDVRKVALALSLRDLQLNATGQWQGRDRYDNEFTITAPLIKATLGEGSASRMTPPQSLDEAV